MAPNLQLGSKKVAADELNEVHYPRHKLCLGQGNNDEGNIGEGNPLPSLLDETKDFFIETALGRTSDYSMLGVVSAQQDVGLDFKDVWSGGGDLIYPTVAETWEVVSTSADDISGGTGANTLVLNSLDINYNEQITLITLNGTTPVTIDGTHFRLNSFVLNSVDSATPRASNAGDITLRVVGGGLTRAVMKADTCASFNSHFTIPAGKVAVWIQSSIFTPKGQDVKVRPLFQFSGTGPFLIGGTGLNYQTGLPFPFKTGLVLSEKSEIINQARSTNRDTEITVVLEFVLTNLDILIDNNTRQTWSR